MICIDDYNLRALKRPVAYYPIYNYNKFIISNNIMKGEDKRKLNLIDNN